MHCTFHRADSCLVLKCLNAKLIVNHSHPPLSFKCPTHSNHLDACIPKSEQQQQQPRPFSPRTAQPSLARHPLPAASVPAAQQQQSNNGNNDAWGVSGRGNNSGRVKQQQRKPPKVKDLLCYCSCSSYIHAGVVRCVLNQSMVCV